MAAPCASDPTTTTPRLAARDLTVSRAGGPPLLERVTLAVAPGECVWLRGATGSGKSTLLRALAGLRGAEVHAGRVERRERVAVLLQHIETQLLCTTVGEEVAFGPRRQGCTELEVTARVRTALRQVGLDSCASRNVDTLSAGEKQRAVIAALLALEPRVLLLDEPTSALDATSRGRLVEILVRLKEQGVAILLAEHDALPGGAWVDRTLSIADGRVCEGADRVRTGAPTRIPAPGAEAAIASVALEGILPLRRGERVLVTGPNGSGKSTWLARVAREQTPSRGAMRERSGTSWVMQEPRRQLGARSVGAEVAFALRRHGVSRGETRRRTHELLGAFSLAAVADRSPLRLSFGQQHRLAFAAALATRPALLLIDEPFAGLDPAARVQLLAALACEQAASGTAIVVASHDRNPLARWCHRSVGIADVGANHA